MREPIKIDTLGDMLSTYEKQTKNSPIFVGLSLKSVSKQNGTTVAKGYHKSNLGWTLKASVFEQIEPYLITSAIVKNSYFMGKQGLIAIKRMMKIDNFLQ